MSVEKRVHTFQPDKYKLVIVDDDPEMRSLLADELEEEGYQVTLAKNGLDILSEIPFQSFDLMITDWKLPLRNGLQILSSVQEVHPEMPVVLITAFGDAKIRKKVEKAGAIYLQKPFSMEAFKKMVRSLLSKKKELKIA